MHRRPTRIGSAPTSAGDYRLHQVGVAREMDRPKYGSNSCASEMRKASRPNLNKRGFPLNRVAAVSILRDSRSVFVRVTPPVKEFVRVPNEIHQNESVAADRRANDAHRLAELRTGQDNPFNHSIGGNAHELIRIPFSPECLFIRNPARRFKSQFSDAISLPTQWFFRAYSPNLC